MRSDHFHEIEFHYGDFLIGIGYNLTCEEAEELWYQWEQIDDDHWCMDVYTIEV